MTCTWVPDMWQHLIPKLDSQISFYPSCQGNSFGPEHAGRHEMAFYTNRVGQGPMSSISLITHHGGDANSRHTLHELHITTRHSTQTKHVEIKRQFHSLQTTMTSTLYASTILSRLP